MEVGQIWAFAIQFAVTLSLSIGWLIICRILRSIRLRIGVTLAYFGAGTIASLCFILSPDGPTLSGAIASLLVMALLYFRWKRTLKKQCLNAGTIIGFELT